MTIFLENVLRMNKSEILKSETKNNVSSLKEHLRQRINLMETTAESRDAPEGKEITAELFAALRTLEDKIEKLDVFERMLLLRNEKAMRELDGE